MISIDIKHEMPFAQKILVHAVQECFESKVHALLAQGKRGSYHEGMPEGVYKSSFMPFLHCPYIESFLIYISFLFHKGIVSACQNI